jgi:4-hydroxymandelate oxidase
VAAVDRIETVVAQAVTQPVNLLEYEAVARGLIPRPQFEFIAGGSGDEISLRGNRAAYGRWRLLPRMMSGVESPSLATTVLGDHVSLPVLVSPMGLHCLAHKDGERATASAVQRAGTIFCLSVAASQSMEEVAPLAGAWWFQLYLLVDRGLSVEHVRRAETAGASAIVLTVDVTVRGRREADERNQFALPPGMSMPNLLPADFEGEVPSYALFTAWDKTISWRDLEWLAGITKLPVVVKGILSPQDALLAVEHGAKAIIVSNHGGRQLDSAVASLDALPAVAAAIGERAEILLDGGIRRGTDVVKALALGAIAVAIGRPVIWGLAVNGEEGVVHVLDMLRAEVARALALCGCASPRDPGRDLVRLGRLEA